MEDWVEVIRNKLGEMGILAVKGNLYSRTPLGPPVTKPVIRDPTSPLPQPPENTSLTVSLPSTETSETSTATKASDEVSSNNKPKRNSFIDTSAGQNQTFTTSIYLNQTSAPKSPTKTNQNQSSLIVNRKTSLPVNFNQKKTSLSQSMSNISTNEATAEASTTLAAVTTSSADVAISSGASSSSLSAAGATSSVYLNQSSPTRHVTVIPINNDEAEETVNDVTEEEKTTAGGNDSSEFENHTYGAIFDFDEMTISKVQEKQEKTTKTATFESRSSPRKQQDKDISPQRRGRDRTKQSSKAAAEPPPLPDRPVLRRLSDRKHEVMEGRANIQQRIRRKSRRSSSLGPLLDGNIFQTGDMGASTLSLESVDSNPRQAMARSDHRHLGAVPRRPLHADHQPNPPSPTHPVPGVNTNQARNLSDLPPGVRPPPYHPLSNIGPVHHSNMGPGSGGGFPPMIPLPGLTCQLSVPPVSPVSLPPVPGHEDQRPGHQRSVREQQVS